MKRRRNNQRQVSKETSTTTTSRQPIVDAIPYKQQRSPRYSRYPNDPLLPFDHPFKVIWDVTTALLSLLNAYFTHIAIRDRQFNSKFLQFTQIWFALDGLLTCFSVYRTSDGVSLKSYRAVWARYLTTWFLIDALALIPNETIYLKPIIEQQNHRHFLVKLLFRSRAILRVTRTLRRKHFTLFHKASQQTGIGANQLLRMIIKYAPKYIMFFRNMKGVLLVRIIRQIRYWHRARMHWIAWPEPEATLSLTVDQEEVASWEQLNDNDDDDDGLPF